MSRKLPQISSDIPRDLRMFLDRLREVIAATGDDRFVTAKELVNAGVVKIERTGNVASPNAGVNLPPAPQNVVVVGNIQTIVISWNAPTFEGFSLAEIWGHTANDINAASKVGTSPGVDFRDPVGPLTSKYYWVRFMNTAGKYGPFASATGGLGVTADVERYTATNLRADLASGAVTVIAGALNSTSIIKTFPTYMAFQHKDALLNGTTAAYTGDFRTGLGITSTGIVGGYNDKTTGVWQTTLALEAATGNLTVLGTIKANSVIQVGALLGSQTVSSVLSDVSSASSNASSALSQVGDKLNKSGSDILSGGVTFSSAGGFKTGTISIDGSGNVTGAGVAFTSKGIVGRNASATTFSIDAATGAALFGGRIETSDYVAATGTAYVAGTQTLSTTGSSFSVAGSIVGTTSPTATAFQVRCGVYGYIGGAYNANSVNAGLVGISSTSDANGWGAYGQGYVGLFGSSNSNGTGVTGLNLGAGASISCSGKFAWGSYTYSQPDGGVDKYLRNDGTWALIGNVVSGVVTLNGVGGTVTNSFAAVCTFPGVGYQVSGSGTNSVTYTISQTSDRSLKKDIQPNTLGMAFIRQLEPVTYYYADNTMFGFKKKMYGLIANDVMDIAGEESSLVYINTTGSLAGKLAADYASYVAPIITALKEIDARLARLEQANVT